MAAFVIATAYIATGFLHPAASFPTKHTRAKHPLHSSCSPACRAPFLLQSGEGDEPAGQFKNEFSRTVPPETVLKLHGGKQQKPQQREYSVEISASPDEKNALATRFSIPHIDALDASLSLRPEGTSGVENARGVVVEGQVHATVTRTCVLSNEEFDVGLVFPVYSIVRPVKRFDPISANDFYEETSNAQLSRGGSKRSGNKKKKSHAKDEYNYGENELDPMEVLKIKSMLEESAEQQQGDFNDDILMEDESIYAINGMLDVGELVSQLFWLHLDPYPKKPGSEFIQFSISG